MRFLHRTWAVVDLDAISHNAKELRHRLSPNCQLMSVVKADCYGHGDAMASEALEPLSDWFAVSNLEEGISLRQAGREKPILILGATPPQEADRLVAHRITPAVYTLEHARALDRAAGELGACLTVHVKVDTGLGRLGFMATPEECERARAEITTVSQLPNLHIGGIFTHFSVADEASEESVAYTKEQIAAFQKLCEALEESGVHTGLRHCCNSAGVSNYPEAHWDMVRPGAALFGLSVGELFDEKIDLWPAMELYSTVTMVKTIPAGRSLSYGRTFVSQGEMRVATVAVGYGDGYSRRLSNKGRVLVHGEFAPVVGRVCMDQLLLDVTQIEGVQAGDVVTLVGKDGKRSIDFSEIAALCETVPMELVSNVGRRVPRIYRQNGREIAMGQAKTILTYEK